MPGPDAWLNAFDNQLFARIRFNFGAGKIRNNGNVQKSKKQGRGGEIC
jgi:hypothetical protein